MSEVLADERARMIKRGLTAERRFIWRLSVNALSATAAGGRNAASGSNIQSDRAHELDAVALGHDARPQFEIELELSVHEFVLEVHIPMARGFESRNIGERQIVGADQADGAFFSKARMSPCAPARRSAELVPCSNSSSRNSSGRLVGSNSWRRRVISA